MSEFTDTTQIDVRYRVTRSVTAQVAEKRAETKCYPYSVYLLTGRRSNGSWGSLKGHIMFTDRMPEKNVN